MVSQQRRFPLTFSDTLMSGARDERRAALICADWAWYLPKGRGKDKQLVRKEKDGEEVKVSPASSTAHVSPGRTAHANVSITRCSY